MPVNDLGKLGMRMRAARNEMGLTQQRLSDMCHVSIREIAKIENGEMNPSFLILKAIIQVLHNSLDSLIISDGSADEGAEQMKMLYLSCPPEMQETLLNNTKRLTEELISLGMYTLSDGSGLKDLFFSLCTKSLIFLSRFFPYSSLVTLSIPTALLPSNSL